MALGWPTLGDPGQTKVAAALNDVLDKAWQLACNARLALGAALGQFTHKYAEQFADYTIDIVIVAERVLLRQRQVGART